MRAKNTLPPGGGHPEEGEYGATSDPLLATNRISLALFMLEKFEYPETSKATRERLVSDTRKVRLAPLLMFLSPNGGGSLLLGEVKSNSFFVLITVASLGAAGVGVGEGEGLGDGDGEGIISHLFFIILNPCSISTANPTAAPMKLAELACPPEPPPK